jgi:uncharacterized phage infection (PIP) family protein YhgE
MSHTDSFDALKKKWLEYEKKTNRAQADFTKLREQLENAQAQLSQALHQAEETIDERVRIAATLKTIIYEAEAKAAENHRNR